MRNYSSKIPIDKHKKFKKKCNELLQEVLYLPAIQFRQPKPRPFTKYKLESDDINHSLLRLLVCEDCVERNFSLRKQNEAKKPWTIFKI